MSTSTSSKTGMIGSESLWKVLKDRHANRVKKLHSETTDEDIKVRKICCPSCKQAFGISEKFEKFAGDTNYRFTCPYCCFEACLDHPA